jgi:hypothetical protein
MRMPVIQGLIDRRILANYRVDPEVMSAMVPAPFRPKLVRGCAIGGVCLIRLTKIRPGFLRLPWGLRSENAAHRIAVEWDDDEGTQQGVYIPRRDTNSRLNSLVGGRLFPGIHNHARFSVAESDEEVAVAVESDDHKVRLKVCGRVSDSLPASSVFRSVDEASAFFEAGSMGYSVTDRPGRFDALELQCRNWSVVPLAVSEIESTFFEDRRLFPAGSAEFDCALLMRGVQHAWHSRPELCCAAT